MFVHSGADPAPGEEFSVTVPPRRRWIVHSLRVAFTTAVGGGARTVVLAFDDGATVFGAFPSPSTHLANVTASYTFSHLGHVEVVVLTDKDVAFPKLPLPSGSRIFSNTDTIQAGDNYGPPRLLVEEWIDP